MSETTTRYPQPGEGITGTDRTQDDLLDLDDKAVARRLMAIGTARALYSAVLVGNPAPKVAEMYARISSPRPGDLVLETTSGHRDTDTQIKGFGILVEHRKEWAQTDAEWQRMTEAGEVGGDDRFPEDTWYVQYGPAAEDVCRWTNCQFVAIPTSRSFFPDQAPGNGVITCAGLVANLGDSGFFLR